MERASRQTPSVIAIDTNILVRLMMADDPRQLEGARNLLSAGPVFVSLVALMEAEWVLRSRYSLSRKQIVAAMRDVIAFESVSVELPDQVEWALRRLDAGSDLADMILLIASRETERFATFDRRLLRENAQGSPVAVELLA